MDGKFEAGKEKLPIIVVNTRAANKHVGEIASRLMLVRLHLDCQSRMGGAMSLGKKMPITESIKQTLTERA